MRGPPLSACARSWDAAAAAAAAAAVQIRRMALPLANCLSAMFAPSAGHWRSTDDIHRLFYNSENCDIMNAIIFNGP